MRMWALYYRDPITEEMVACTSGRFMTFHRAADPALYAQKENAEKILREFYSSCEERIARNAPLRIEFYPHGQVNLPPDGVYDSHFRVVPMNITPLFDEGTTHLPKPKKTKRI